MTAVLEVQGVSLAFGGLKAVNGFGLTLRKGGLHGLIGPNGAGKTTIFNLLTGVYQPGEGSIALEGRSLAGMKPHEIAATGIARTFQNIRLFANLSVLDNVRVACHLRTRHTMLAAVLRTPSHRSEEAEILERTHKLLALFGLDSRAHEQAGSLPYGDQRRLEIARALATHPRVLLLDEPAAGMNPQEKAGLSGLIRRLRDDFAVSVLLIEHDMSLVMGICETVTVLDHGEVIAEGPPEAVQANPAVIAAYLGEPAAQGASA